MKTIKCYDLSGGINYEESKLKIGSSNNKVYWYDSKNIRPYKSNGITVVSGNKSILETDLGEGVYITGIFGNTKVNNIPVCVFTSSDGKFYYFNFSNGLAVEVVDGLYANEKTAFEVYGQGIICCDGVTEGFVYFSQRRTLTTGTVSVTYDDNLVSGTGTLFTSEFMIGDLITVNGETHIIETILDDETIRTRQNFVDAASGVTITRNKVTYLNSYFTTNPQLVGSVDVSIGSNVVSGTGTKFLSDLSVGDVVRINSEYHIIDSITNDTTMTTKDDFLADKSDEYIIYVKGVKSELITSKVFCTYYDRIWMAKDEVLYWSSLGNQSNWFELNDAGFNADIGLPITNIKPFKSYLMLHNGQQNGITLMSGSTNPSQFSFDFKFSDRGSSSPWGVCTIENQHFFDDDGVFTLAQVGELNQIRLTQELSKQIHPQNLGFLNGKYISSRSNEVIAVPYPKRKEIWFYFPQDTNNYFNIVWVYDYVNKAWFKIEQPQNITCATLFDNQILTGTDDGKILIEDFGSQFDGTAIDFMFESQFFNFGEANKEKEVDDFYIITEGININNFLFGIRTDYNEASIYDEYNVKIDDLDNGIWDDANSVWDGTVKWAVSKTDISKEQMFGEFKSIQLVLSGGEGNSMTILGFEFRNIFVDE